MNARGTGTGCPVPPPPPPPPTKGDQLSILTAIVEASSPLPAVRGQRPAWARFWEKVDRTDPSGCWLWTASTSHNGYGQFTVTAVPIKAHRWAYTNLVGPIPAGLQLDHVCHSTDELCPGGGTCRHRRCVNPAHLEPVTARTNTHRGTGVTAVNRRKTHCDHGHPFDAVNTQISKSGWRACRRCLALKMRARRAKQRQLAAAAGG